MNAHATECCKPLASAMDSSDVGFATEIRDDAFGMKRVRRSFSNIVAPAIWQFLSRAVDGV